MNAFNGLIFTEDIGESPAAVHLRSGILYINPKIFFSYPKVWQKFIVLHELGHWMLKTRDEEKADNFAFHHFATKGERLRDAVESLLYVLDEGHPAHKKRIKALLETARFWDQEVFGKEFKTPQERKIAMNEYLKKETEQLAFCLGQKDCDGCKTHMANIIAVVEPVEADKLSDKFANIIADLEMGSYNGRYMGDMAYFFCFGNEKCKERKQLKQKAKAEFLKCKRACMEKQTDELEKFDGDAVVDAASKTAGFVANLIVPGAGVLVEKVTAGGGKIISGLVEWFKKKKAEGKTDLQIQNDPYYLEQKAAAEAELEQLYTESAIFQEKYAKYLGQFTDADRTFSTMRKAAKFKKELLPGAGSIKEGIFYYGIYKLKLADLNVFKPVFGLGDGVKAPVWEKTPPSGTATQPTTTSATGMADPTSGGTAEDADKKDEEKPKSKMGLIIGIVLAIIVIAAIVAYFMLRKKS